MWRRIALTLAMAWVPPTSLVGIAEERERLTLFAQCKAIKLDVVLGRIVVTPRHRGAVRDTLAPSDNHESSELLVVNSDDECPLVRYERSDSRATLAIEIHHFDRILMHSELHRDAAYRSFEFRQPANGPVHLAVHDGDGIREITAKSLWHLLVSERRLCQESILPVLEGLRPDWNLSEMSERVELQLLRGALADRPLSRDDVERLLCEFDAPQFQRRQLADNQLRSFGPFVLPHLDSLADRDREAGRMWSTEQRTRIQLIRQSFTWGSDDTPNRIANWLADNAQIWLALLKHPDPECRRLAATRMSILHPRGIQFDPDGDESHRQEQLVQLRRGLGQR